ncbi:hypothetical protein ES703_57793 [subsurface metagenome]
MYSFLILRIVNSFEFSAFITLLLYDNVVLNPEINKNPEAANGAKSSKSITFNHLSSYFNHQSNRCPIIIRKIQNPRIASILLILFIIYEKHNFFMKVIKVILFFPI